MFIEVCGGCLDQGDMWPIIEFSVCFKVNHKEVCQSHEQDTVQKPSGSDSLPSTQNRTSCTDIGKILSPRENRQNTDCISPPPSKTKQKGVFFG